jgi:DNA-binding LacI/PurR family transcriptional regulator
MTSASKKKVPNEPGGASRPRLVDVAKICGVAPNTASMILNQKPNCWASESTKQRVIKAAQKLGYRPNRIALAVRKGRYGSIGLIVPDVNNPFFMSLAHHLELAAESRGCDLIVEHSRFDLLREERCLDTILDRHVDGIIACLIDPPAHRKALQTKLKHGVPIVVAGPNVRHPLPVDLVAVDFEDGVRQALLYLKEMGHTRVGFIRALAQHQVDHREQFFLNVATRLGFDPHDLSIEAADHTLAGAKDAFNRLIRSPGRPRPTAVIGLNDLCAIGALRGAWEAGLQVPGDLSVIGADNISLCDYTCPSLTTIAQPVGDIGTQAVQMLFERIDRKTKAAPRKKVLSSKLVIRESAGKAPRN